MAAFDSTFEKIYNFRQAGGEGLTNIDGETVKDCTVYRSARPDSATSSDKALLKQLNLKSIVDLRGLSDYSKRVNKPMEDFYTPLVIANGTVKEQYRPKPSQTGYLYIIDLIQNKRHGWHLVQQLNIFLRLISLFLIPIDYLFGTRFTQQFYGRQVVNKMELWEHYVDVLEYSKPEVAEVLRLVSDPNNLPILIHCELGKDRTGYIVALILSCIGVDDDAIIEDYAKTEVFIVIIIIDCNNYYYYFYCRMQ